jgi:hypothetical protein
LTLGFIFLFLLHLGPVKLETGNFKFVAILYAHVLDYLIILWLWAGNTWARLMVEQASHSCSLERGLEPVLLLCQSNTEKGQGWGRGDLAFGAT